MSNKEKHIIKKQVMRVSVPAGENSYTVQEQLGPICRQKLPRVLEQICNEICMEDYYIKLNKISLDLGTLPAGSLETALSESVAERLAEALTDAIGTENRHLNTMKAQKKSPASPVELLKYFLSTGTLPDWIESSSISLEQLFDRAMGTDPGTLCNFIRRSSHKNSLCKRLAAIVQGKQLKTLAAVFTKTNAFDALIDELLSPGNTAPASDRLNLLTIKESLLSYLLHYESDNILAGKKTLAPGIMERIGKGEIFRGDTSQKDSLIPQLRMLIKARPEVLAQLILRAGQNHEKYIGMAELLSRNSSSLSGETIGNICEEIVELLSDSTTFRRDVYQLMASAGIEVRSEQDNKKHDRPPSVSKVQRCTLHNAGLVILWPGIPSLFETCGLIQDNTFIDERAAERAVLLLQYAADGRTEVPEFELPLNKILCGLAVDTPVATSFKPTATEKAAVRDLLQSVIAEWNALRGSSPEALQVNYLQRAGTMTPRGDHWQLDIERQTRDILLDRLSWGIGVIKLPWMKYILYTEW